MNTTDTTIMPAVAQGEYMATCYMCGQTYTDHEVVYLPFATESDRQPVCANCQEHQYSDMS